MTQQVQNRRRFARRRIYANPQEITDLLTYHGGLLIFTWMYLFILMPSFIGGPAGISPEMPQTIRAAITPFLVPVDALAAHIFVGAFILLIDASVYERVRYYGGPRMARHWLDQIDSVFALVSFTALSFGIISFCWASALNG